MQFSSNSQKADFQKDHPDLAAKMFANKAVNSKKKKKPAQKGANLQGAAARRLANLNKKG